MNVGDRYTTQRLENGVIVTRTYEVTEVRQQDGATVTFAKEIRV